MPQGLILEFDGDVGREAHKAIDATLGVNAHTRAGDWPARLLLGPAIAHAGLPAPVRVQWLEQARRVNLES